MTTEKEKVVAKTKVGDLVSTVYLVEVTYIARKPEPYIADTLGSHIREPFVHEAM